MTLFIKAQKRSRECLSNLSLGKLPEIVKDKKAWHAAVHGVEEWDKHLEVDPYGQVGVRKDRNYLFIMHKNVIVKPPAVGLRA